jgi:mRNA interferase HicA
MKRVKFIKYLNKLNCGFVKHGGKHDKYMNHDNGKRTMIPRHPDIDDDLCDLICKQLEVPKFKSN